MLQARRLPTRMPGGNCPLSIRRFSVALEHRAQRRRTSSTSTTRDHDLPRAQAPRPALQRDRNADIARDDYG